MGVGGELPTVTPRGPADPWAMLMRCTAAALIALSAAACVEMGDDSIDEFERRPPAAAAEAPSVDGLDYGSPSAPPPAPVNQRPVPGTDMLATTEDTAVTVRVDSLLDNDVDPEGGRVVFVQLGTDKDGVATVHDRVVTFTPDADFNGVARFDYVISDGRLMAAGTVMIHVAPVNDAPVAYGDHITVTAGAEVEFTLESFDAEADPLVTDIAEPPSHGSLELVNGRYTYRPEAGWTGMDRLVYRVGDAEAWSELVDVELVTMPTN